MSFFLFVYCYLLLVGWDSPVSIATYYRLNCPCDQIPVGAIFSGPETHAASCTLRVFRRGKAAGAWH